MLPVGILTTMLSPLKEIGMYMVYKMLPIQTIKRLPINQRAIFISIFTFLFNSSLKDSAFRFKAESLPIQDEPEGKARF